MALKYLVVADDIESKIRNGELKPQKRLPSCDELCETYGVSRITVRKAMDVLYDRGLVIKRRGSGTYVKDVDPEDSSPLDQQVLGYSESAREIGASVDTQVLAFEICEATGVVAERLKVPEKTLVYHIERLRSIEGGRGLVAYTWIPVKVVPNLTKQQVAKSIYRHIEVGLGLTVSSTHRSIRAVMPSLNERIWLSLPADMPVLEIDQVSFLSDGRLFEYTVLHHDTRDWSFRCVDTK
ncbi:GntR family transcriptional regulator [Atopobiaceae bacterium 24-176]